MKSNHLALVMCTSESNLEHSLPFRNSEVIYLKNMIFICLAALEKNSVKKKSNPLWIWVSVSVNALLKALFCWVLWSFLGNDQVCSERGVEEAFVTGAICHPGIAIN